MARPPKLSKAELLKEVVKCGKDPIYFIKSYVRVSHPIRGLIRFKLFPFQEEILKDFTDHRFNVVLKARQLGVSTVIAAFSLWLMLFHKDKNILVIATKLDTAVNVVRKAKSMYKSLPDWLQIVSLTVDNRNSFELSNGSIMKGSATSDDVGRSEALSLLIVDEAAHINNLEELWTGIYPTLSTGGACIMASTPNGAAGYFFKTYVASENGDNEFHHSSYDWTVHPERNQEWYEKETRNMSKRQIAQELLCSFEMSGQTVFDSSDVERLEKQEVKDPLYRTAFDRNLWVWEDHIPGLTYLISADVARGDGEDFSVAQIMKIGPTNEVVAEYQGKATPDIFANFLFQIGKQWGESMIVVENNSVGYAVLDKLIESGYPNVYYATKSSHEYMEQYEAEQRSGVVAGFSTTAKTRPLIVAKLEEYIRNKLIKIPSRRFLNECKTFVWNGQRPEAQKGYHDDLIMCCAIGCFVRDTVFSINTREIEYKKAFLDSMFRSNTTLNTKIGGQIGAPKNIGLEERMKEYKMYGWLYKG